MIIKPAYAAVRWVWLVWCTQWTDCKLNRSLRLSLWLASTYVVTYLTKTMCEFRWPRICHMDFIFKWKPPYRERPSHHRPHKQAVAPWIAAMHETRLDTVLNNPEKHKATGMRKESQNPIKDCLSTSIRMGEVHSTSCQYCSLLLVGRGKDLS